MNAKDIVEKRFETVKKGGYNIDDVDRFLRDVSVEYLGIQKENEELEEKLRAEEAATSQKTFELERSVNLSEIEEEATTRLGMQRPEKHQIIYINVPQNDVTSTTSGEVEGFTNTLKSFLSEAGRTIVEFFSIK